MHKAKEAKEWRQREAEKAIVILKEDTWDCYAI